MDNVKVALSAFDFTYSLTTNNQGNAGLYIFPMNAVFSFLRVLNANDFVPTTGDQTAATFFLNGPLFNVSSNLR